ncbi:MAG: asparagine synthase (glutamine-hydrolyzing) [Bacillota bacterium]|jgi:asparagine synthase (glutamine-hydrolysing)|nr:asparagine synthase (glutamine-hydrolyzing) [Bacillota bacterium]
MPGIAGIVNPLADISNQCSHICPVSDAVRTRGPVGTSLYISPHCIMACRIANESMPGESPCVTKIKQHDKEYIIVMDGTIYNYRELRSQLESYGCKFQGNSFSELVGYGYAIWNSACFMKLNGLFALAIWVVDDKKLVLARDHIGAKPLYYSFLRSTMVFASEIGGVTSHPLFKAEVGVEGLSELICLSPRNTPGNAVIKGIHELRPAHYLTFSPGGTVISRYWRIEEREHTDSAEETARQIRELITESISMQTTADYPVCGLLSGGLYSSLITAIICKNKHALFNHVYNTWSVEYEKSSKLTSMSFQSDSDIPWIRWICRELGTRHHYILLSTEDLLEALFEASEARGSPGTGDYDSALMLLFREISKEFPTIISGDCSDELFGYGIRSADHSATGRRRFPWVSNLAERISVFSTEIVEWIKPYEYIDKCYEEALFEYPRFALNATGLKKDFEAQWFSLYWNLPCILGRLDRTSMSYNLQARVPLCDYRLIEYLWNVPIDMKRYNGVDRGILIKSVQDLLPREILERKKRAFPRPIDPLYGEKIRNALKESVYDTESALRYLLDIRTLESMMRQQDACKRQTSYQQLFIWLIQLNGFFKSHNIRVL